MDRKTLGALAVLFGGLFLVVSGMQMLVPNLGHERLENFQAALAELTGEEADGSGYEKVRERVLEQRTREKSYLDASGASFDLDNLVGKANLAWEQAQSKADEGEKIVTRDDSADAKKLEDCSYQLTLQLHRAKETLGKAEALLKVAVRDKETLATRVTALSGLSRGLEANIARAGQALSSEAAFLKPYQPSPSWDDQLRDLERKKKEELAAAVEEAVRLHKAMKRPAMVALVSILGVAEQSAASLSAAAKRIAEDTSRLVSFKKERGQRVAAARKSHELLTKAADEKFHSQVELASTEFGDQAKVLSGWLVDLERREKSADELFQRLELENKKAEGGERVDILAMTRDINRLKGLGESHKTDLVRQQGLLKELYTSWDKILADMDVRQSGGGYEYFIEIKTIRVNEKDEVRPSSELRKVSRTEFQKYEQNLGMSLESKPKGKFASEAVKTASPPGFSYMGNPRYGEWKVVNNQRSWHWHPRHRRFVSAIRFGRPYRPWSYSYYTGYRSSMRLRRPYYGVDRFGRRRYGRGGSWTGVAFARSRYSRSSGFSRFRGAISGRRPVQRRSSSYRSPVRRSGYRSTSNSRRSTPVRRSSSYRRSTPARRTSSYRRSSFSSSRSRSRSWGGSRRFGK